MRRTLGLLAVGLGVGMGAGMLAGYVLGWPALVLIGLGAVLLIMSIGDGPDLVGQEPADQAGKPTLAGLGTRVEVILDLAERQAADTIRAAEEEAERIVAEARTRAGGQLRD